MSELDFNTTNGDAEKGYTLVELLLYITIIGILLTSVTFFFRVAVEARVKNQTIAEVNDQGTAAMDYFIQTIRNASSISAPAAAGTGTSLTLVVPTGSLSPTVFNLNGTTLQVTEGTGSAVALTSSNIQITNLTFKNLTKSGTNGNVQVSFTVNRANPNNQNVYDYQKTFTATAEVGW